MRCESCSSGTIRRGRGAFDLATRRSSRATVWLNRSRESLNDFIVAGSWATSRAFCSTRSCSHCACSSACFIRSPTTGIDPTAGGTRELLAMAALNRIASGKVG